MAGMAFYGMFMSMFIFSEPFVSEIGSPFTSFKGIMIAFASIYFLYFALLSALGIAGGIFALKRRKWGIALAGAIAGVLTFMPCGIAAIILISQAQGEFSTKVEEVT
jgi:hypothetical protein